jgi:hypothetical protein
MSSHRTVFDLADLVGSEVMSAHQRRPVPMGPTDPGLRREDKSGELSLRPLGILEAPMPLVSVQFLSYSWLRTL